jgi:hypothetical protein
VARNDPPTPAQQTYLRQLADRTGQTFVTPRTRQEASSQIRRLQGESRSPRYERVEDRRAVTDEQRAALSAARVREDEISGYGSTATWR